MKPLSTVLFSLSILIAIALFALVIFVATFDANRYKAQIAQLVKQQTGRTLALQGDIKLSVYPNIALNLGVASLSNAEGFGNIPFATVKSARVGVQLLPLFKKQLRVERIILDGLQLDLHKKADGSTNWDSFISNSNGEKSKDQLTNDLVRNLSVAGIQLNKATLQWRDEITQQNIIIAPLTLKVGVFRPNQPISVHLKGTLKQQQPALSLSAELSTTLTVTQDNQYFNLQTTRLNATASGLPLSKIALSGDIKGTLKQLDIVGLTLHLEGNDSLLPTGKLQLDLLGDTHLYIEQQRVSLPAMQLQTTLSDLPHTGAIIKANLNGNASANLQHLQIENMRLNANLQNVIANNSHSKTQIKGDARLAFKTLLLSIKNMALDANATNILENAGIANTTITGDLRANLNDLLVDISAMTLAMTAKALPKIGDIQANIAGNLKANLNQQQMTLKNAIIKTNITGEMLSGRHLSAQMSSPNIILDPKQQQFKFHKLTLDALLDEGMLATDKLELHSQGDIDLDLAHNKGKAQLNNMVLEIAGAKVTGSAKLMRLSPQALISGTFKTNTFKLKQVLTALGITVPITSNANVLGDSQASFQLLATPTSIKLQHLIARLDQSKITGELSVNNFQHPAIKTKLNIDQWVVDDYLAPVDPKTALKNQSNDKLLPVKMMQALNLNGSVDIKKLRFDQVNFTKVHASINAKKGIINAKPLRFHAYKGHYNGALTLDVTTQTPLITLHHQIKKMRSENLLLQFFQDRYVSGDIDLNTDLSTQGNTVASLKQNLKGSATIEFSKGTIRDSKFAQKVAMAIELFEKNKTKDNGQHEVTFTKLGGDWKANQGVFSTDNMQLLSPRFLITGKGTVNLVKNQLDFKLRLKPKNKKSKLFAPLHIHGAFDQLNYEIELDVLLKALLQEDLYKKQQQIKQGLLDKKAKVLEALEARKQTELEKLRARKEAAQQRLKDEQEKLRQRLQDQQLKTQQLLQDNLKREQDKVDDATKKVTEDIQKNIEEDAKNKLQDLFKGLF